MLSRSEYFDRWAGWHGVHPSDSALVRGWLSLVYAVASPLRRVPPAVLTAAGVLVSVGVPLVCLLGDGWLLVAALLAALGGLLDSLDGAVAMLTGRDGRLGYVVDSLADRVSDAAYVAALWVLGAPGWLCAIGAGLAFLQEYARARAGAAGMKEIGVITVWERPTRVILTALLLVGMVVVDAMVGDADWIAVGGAVAWDVLGLVGVVQVMLAIVVALRLRRPP